MIEKDPLSYTSLTYAWVILLSIWGGISGYIRRFKRDQKFSLAELIGELSISAFVGILTFFLCESAQIQPVMSAALVGVSGHMGSRAIYLIEHLFTRQFIK